MTPPPTPSSPVAAPTDWPSAPPTEPPLQPSTPFAPGAGSWRPAPNPYASQPATGPATAAGGYGPPPSGRRTALIVAIVLLTIAILTATFAAGMIVNRNQSESSAPTTTTTLKRSTTTAPPTTEQVTPTTRPRTTVPTDPGSGTTGTIDRTVLSAEVHAIMSFVEKDRGHSFKQDVDVEVLERPEFEKRVLESFDKERDSMERDGELFKALGLIPADLDVVEAQRKLLGSGVLGFYDPETKALVVGGDHIGPFLREVLAHELTHALDDQWFDLNRPAVDQATDGSDWAFLALVEGSAKRVENDYVDKMSADDRQTLEDEQTALGMDQLGAMLNTPMVLAQIQLAPYDYGEPFVRTLVDTHGIAALDAAFGAPPTTSEQVLHNDKFDAHEPALDVSKPTSDGAASHDGVLGELMTGFLLHANDDPTNGIGGMTDQELQDLLDKIMNGEISPDELNRILGGGPGSSGLGNVDTVDGWGGDHYVTWTSAAQGVCIRIDWKMDDAGAMQFLKTALDTWAAADLARPVVEQPAPDLVQATRCTGPATGSTTPSTRPPRTTPPTTTTS